MANGVIPPPGGASPLPQVTDARGGGRRGGGGTAGGGGGVLWSTLGHPPNPHPGMELGGDMEKEGGGLLVFFLSVDPSGPKPLRAWEADPSLGLRE